MIPTEVELKLTVEADDVAALRRDAALAKPIRHGAAKLDNTYFDTPDLHLLRGGVGVRIRKHGRKLLQTVKCAGVVTAGVSARAEWEHAFDGHFDFSPVSDVDLQRMLEKRREQLVPVFSTQFRREFWLVQPQPGCEIEVALDRGEIIAGDKRLPLIELELELHSGTHAQLLAFARNLATRFALLPDERSKAQRGYALFKAVAGEAPRRAQRVALRAGDTPIEAFCRIAWECIDQIAANLRGARDATDPEFAHQLRIGVRRLRSALRLFRPLLPADFVAASTARLRQLARLPAPTREWDVLIHEILEPVVASASAYEGIDALLAHATLRRDGERAAMQTTLRAPAPGALLLALMDDLGALADAQAGVSQPVLAEFAAWRVSRLAKRTARRARAARDGDPLQLHALRLALKRLRYTLEFVAPLLRARHDVPMRRLIALQASLGVLNDLHASGPLIESIAADQPELVPAIALVGGHHLAAWNRRAEGGLLRGVSWRQLARGWAARRTG